MCQDQKIRAIHQTVASLHELFDFKLGQRNGLSRSGELDLDPYLVNADLIIFGAFYLESLANFMLEKVFNNDQLDRYFDMKKFMLQSNVEKTFIREFIGETELSKLKHPEGNSEDPLIKREFHARQGNSFIKLIGILKKENAVIDLFDWDIKPDDDAYSYKGLLEWSRSSEKVLASYVNDIFQIRNHFAHGKTYTCKESHYTTGELIQKRVVRLTDLYLNEIIKIENIINRILHSQGNSYISDTPLWIEYSYE